MPDYPPLDWDKMYSDGIAPWDDPAPWAPLESLARANCKPGSRVLEVGCGYGGDAVHLANLGYRVTATDLSSTALEKARQLADDANVEFRLEEFYGHSDEQKYELIFEKGVLVNAQSQEMRELFAKTAAGRLVDGGTLITVCGSLDNLSRNETALDERGYPRVSLRELIEPVEPHFEIRSVSKELFGTLDDNRYECWVVVARSRRRLV